MLPGAVRVQRLLDPAQGEGHTKSGDPGVDPEQRLPSHRIDEDPADQGTAAAPIADAAPQWETALRALRPGGGNGEQAQATSQDRRARRPLDGTAANHTGRRVGQCDRHAGGDEQSRPPMKMRRRPKTSPRAPAVTMKAAPTKE